MILDIPKALQEATRRELCQDTKCTNKYMSTEASSQYNRNLKGEQGRYNNFDLLRLLAAIQVMFCHAIEHFKIPLNNYIIDFVYAFPGVPIFFGISGFLIAKSYIENKGNLRQYAINRILRIYPGLWMNMIVLILMLQFTGAIHLETFRQLTQFVAFQIVQFTTGSGSYISFLIGNPYDFSHFYKSIPSGVWWTITVELGFYLLVPVIYKYAVTNQKKRLALVIIISTLISLVFAGVNSYLHQVGANKTYSALMSTILPYLWIFLFAGSIYLNWQRLSKLFEGKIIYWLTAYLLFTCYFHKGSPDFQIINAINVFRVLFMCCTVLSFAYSWKNLAKILNHTDLSYGIYLWHMPVITTLVNLGLQKEIDLLVPVFLITFCLAAISWFVIEKPAMKLKYKLYDIGVFNQNGVRRESA